MFTFNQSILNRRCAISLVLVSSGVILSLLSLLLAQEREYALPAAIGTLALGLAAFLLNLRNLMYLSMGCSALISYQYLEYQSYQRKGPLEATPPSSHASGSDLAPFDQKYLSQR